MKTAIVLLVIVLCLLPPSTAYRPAIAERRYTLYAPVVMSSGQMSSVACGEGECE